MYTHSTDVPTPTDQACQRWRRRHWRAQACARGCHTVNANDGSSRGREQATGFLEEALELQRRGIGDVLMGEVEGKRPEGFDYGNSPFEIAEVDFTGKSIVQSTRAGTVGVAASEKAETIYLGSFAVAQATVDTILRDNPQVVSIIAMGDQGVVRSDEDEHCGLYLRNLLEGRTPDQESVRSLILKGGATQKFFYTSQPQYHPEDVELALQFNKHSFAMKVTRQEGLLVANKILV